MSKELDAETLLFTVLKYLDNYHLNAFYAKCSDRLGKERERQLIDVANVELKRMQLEHKLKKTEAFIVVYDMLLAILGHYENFMQTHPLRDGTDNI